MTKEQRLSPEEIFLKDIRTLINNLLINNVNYTNGYYGFNDTYKVIKDTQDRAKYILDRIDAIDHLVTNELSSALKPSEK